MQKHTKLYMEFFDYFGDEYIPCEMCNKKAVDIHHIVARGMGGSEKDKIENLMALCRSCHIKYGDKKHYLDMLNQRHKLKINRKNK
jgi:5-methylcytosine-specific restriction endonuclease McrA